MNLDEFYSGIVTDLRAKGVPCAITGGLACVEFGIVEHTEDCDLLCAPEHARQLLETLGAKTFHGAPCQYRSQLSPPLEARWLAGGYTCHFQWPGEGAERPYLDVIGVPPRVSSPWEAETQGAMAGRHTVAEMKRTNRRKDWDQATALGLQMIEAGDERGWLHVFDADALRALVETTPCSEAAMAQRPVLRLAAEKSPLLDRAVQTEVDFWTNLDRARLKLYEESVRAYAAALRHDGRLQGADLATQHAVRVEHAERLLPQNPVQAFGVDRLIAQAREATALGINPELLRFLPDARVGFRNVVRPT
jgi:hypothetical protein